jgi:hypothetical protein
LRGILLVFALIIALIHIDFDGNLLRRGRDLPLLFTALTLCLAIIFIQGDNSQKILLLHMERMHLMVAFTIF